MRNVLVLLCLVVWGVASADERLQDVRKEIGPGVFINWSTMTLEAQTSSTGRGTGSKRKTMEEHARRALSNKIEQGVLTVRVDTNLRVADLSVQPALRRSLEARTSNWTLVEGRYYASGKVELSGTLSLLEVLKPWTARRGLRRPHSIATSEYSGVVIDARATHVKQAFAPRVLGPDGDVVYDGALWKGEALVRAPVVYVYDAAHPAANRAGEHPLFLQATRSKGVDLVLDATSFQRFQERIGDHQIAREGRFVVVVAEP